MSISITVLVYVLIPAVVIALVSSLVFAGSHKSQPDRRYRPGRPYDFRPMWFLASPEQITGAGDGAHARRALTGPVLEDSSGARVKPGSTGGASDSW
ncbi:aa3-type cytochrome oxidase subunit CtaJ [Actinoplanes sp. URMC 104]|uniref:aa3-type cytochrome oxidase subunit CtaJ n=1 Tax=Actinoplanes sp. URMC 104 TaxID=3423409 RepID=UPI003F1CB462